MKHTSDPARAPSSPRRDRSVLDRAGTDSAAHEERRQRPARPAPGPAAGEGPAPPVAHHLSALAEPLRLRILRLLEQAELTVGELAKVLQLPQSTVSRHLKLLTDARWLSKRAEGTASFYRLAPEELPGEMRDLWRTVRKQLDDASPALRDDGRRLDVVLHERSTDSLSYFGRVAGEWDAIRADLFGRGFTARAMLALLPRDSVVADLGCGTGNAAERLAPFVKEVIAIDQSQPMLKAAKKRLHGLTNVRFVRGDLTALPLDDASVDIATCILVLHHLDDPAGALREAKRTLRPGGRLVIVDMQRHTRTSYRTVMGHRRLGFDDDEAISMLHEAGFTDARLIHLTDSPEGKGPGLFVAVASAPTS